jgi:hypothetical protein
MSDNAIVVHSRYRITSYPELPGHLGNERPGATTVYLVIRHRANALI